MCTVQIINEVPETIFSLCPDYKNIVNIPPPCVRFCLSLCNCLSSLSIKILAYDGAIRVPIAVPSFWTKCFPSNSKLLFLRTISVKSTMSFFRSPSFFPSSKLESQANNASFTACNPSSCGIWGYNPTTSTVHVKMRSIAFMK